MSSNLRVDALFLAPQGFCELSVLQPPQPIWIAEKILHQLRKLPSRDLVRRFSKIGPVILSEIYPQKRIHTIQLSGNDLPGQGVIARPPPEIDALFEGYSLLGGEIPELLKKNGWDPPWDVEDWLQYFYLSGKVRREAAVTLDALGLPVCRRCGSTRDLIRDSCAFCGFHDCYTCPNCQTMGISKSCTPLYFQPCGRTSFIAGICGDDDSKLEPHLEFNLTEPQIRASQQLEKFLDSDAAEFLVWTVCGGGKTEVSFAAVAKVLGGGGRVLYAIPRKDVVCELLPRFQKAFPQVETVGLYGGCGETLRRVPLTLATTHQCLRFYEHFDLIILDEADAYPYQGNPMLCHAVRRALKSTGKFVIMSATPEQRTIRQAFAGQIPYVSIPARYHHQPLIVPEWRKDHGLGPILQSKQSQGEPSQIVQHFLLEVREQGRKALVFLPTLQLIRGYGPLIVEWAGRRGIPGDCVYAASPNRDEAKRAFGAAQLCFLVTSTILERGITVPNLDVLVLEADYEAIFDSRSLVQIAGRAGRLGDAARVVFAAKRVSHAMKECQLWIKRMNQEGYQLGYLDYPG